MCLYLKQIYINIRIDSGIVTFFFLRQLFLLQRRNLRNLPFEKTDDKIDLFYCIQLLSKYSRNETKHYTVHFLIRQDEVLCQILFKSLSVINRDFSEVKIPVVKGDFAHSSISQNTPQINTSPLYSDGFRSFLSKRQFPLVASFQDYLNRQGQSCREKFI